MDVIAWQLILIGACPESIGYARSHTDARVALAGASDEWIEWLRDRCDGSGYGNGGGNGSDCDGGGYGSGSGIGDGIGEGYGSGDGDGYGDGYGCGSDCDGGGYGDGDGYGDGYGCGDGDITIEHGGEIWDRERVLDLVRALLAESEERCG